MSDEVGYILLNRARFYIIMLDECEHYDFTMTFRFSKLLLLYRIFLVFHSCILLFYAFTSNLIVILIL